MRKKFISLLLAAVMMTTLTTALITTTVSAEDFTLSPSKLLTPSDLAVLDKTGGTIGGKAYEVECNSEGKTAAIRYDNLSMSPSYAAANRYLLIDIYYMKSSATTTPFGMSVLFRSNGTSTDDWNHIYKQADTVKKPSSGLSALPNRWETIAIDCQAAMDYLSTNSLYQKQLQIEIPATTGTDRVYLGAIRFSATTGDYEFGRTATIMTSSDLMSSPSTVDFSGKTGVQQFSVTSGAHTIRYGGVHMGYAYASSNRYMLIECYLDDDSLDTFSVTTVFRSVNNGGTWINGQATSTRSSGSYSANKWVTVVIDCADPLGYLVTNKYSLTQLQIAFPATTADLYVNSVRFAAEEPPVQMVFTDENGQYTYLSEDGEVTVNGDTIPAYTSTTAAFTALGAEGGTVYLEGNLTAFTDVANGTRGEITLRGLGDTAEDIAANVLYQIRDIEIKGGHITFDYLTVDPYPNAESGVDYTSFFTCQSSAAPIKQITMGEHLESTGLSVNVRKGNETLYANHDVFTINGGTYYAVTPLTNYGLTTLNRLGSVEWTINGGTIHSLYAGSNNSWEWEQSQLRGDVRYTINGGDFDNKLVMGSAYGSTEIKGNIIWTINGGSMFGRTIVGGDEHTTKGNRTQKYLNNVAAIVNLKGGKSGLRSLTLGTEDAKGLDITGKEIYILNNYEDNLGTQIADGSLAEYKIHVYNGKAEPVFANDQSISVNGSTENYGGALTGFTLTPDEVGAVPYVNGVKATPTAGVYDIAEDTSDIIEIVFAQEGTSGVASFSASSSAVTAKMYNFTNAAVTMNMFVAEYNGNLLTNVQHRTYNVTAGTTPDGSISYSKSEGRTYRAFMWGSDLTILANKLDL